eukprot:gnl/MRDRNA2_/MRDRNA2_135244_c0_seq1.p1 gnl/MRDRNA2_/MRDRNA2_135244_c0~~gnl/MRDRNA2_/MRDRNA2_135244_c0_seq1.p1  ORF type:complete len:316 (+),score=73.61 gnl/MRDRNA2_/MRDRNA2_135244_c0_seq1:80-1027(+)
MPSGRHRRGPKAKPLIPAKGATGASAEHEVGCVDSSKSKGVEAPPLQGLDDAGTKFGCIADLWASVPRNKWYTINREFWVEGMNGKSNDEVMLGDETTDADLEASKLFLDKLLTDKVLPRRLKPPFGTRRALDVGAGSGRVTKGLLLKYADTVHLIDGNEHWLQQARRSLGKKRAAQCEFSQLQLQDSKDKVPWEGNQSHDIIWVQLVLQYLTDDDAVALLQRCIEGLSTDGVIIVKENHAEALAKKRGELPHGDPSSFFFVETPVGSNCCFDITRSDAHHRWLFSCAGLHVAANEWEDELVMYALKEALPTDQR